MYPSIVGILNNKLLVSMYDGDDNYEKEWFKYVSDLEGTDVEKLPIDINFISNIYSDENYLFLRPVNTMANLDEYSHIKNEMAIYDLEYNLVDKVDMSKYIGISQLVSGDDDYMFIFYTSDLTTFAVDYLDKKEIGSGNLEFKNLIGN
jgi:glutaredoxin-related protein